MTRPSSWFVSRPYTRGALNHCRAGVVAGPTCVVLRPASGADGGGASWAPAVRDTDKIRPKTPPTMRPRPRRNEKKCMADMKYRLRRGQSQDLTSSGRLFRRLSSHPVFQDRKSTRLNSSHSQISYAVFCFKKNLRNIMYNNTLTRIFFAFPTVTHVMVS